MVMKPTPGLPAPAIDQSVPFWYLDSGILDLRDVGREGLPFTIPAYAGQQDGDTLRMCSLAVGGLDQAIYGPLVTLDATSLSADRTLMVRQITLNGLSLESDSLEFHYEVLKKDGTRQLSAPLSVTVKKPYVVGDLKAPVILNPVKADGTLSSDEKVLRIRIDRPGDGWDRNTRLYVLGTNSTVVKDIPTVTREPSFWQKVSSTFISLKKGVDYEVRTDPSIETALTADDGFRVELSMGRQLRVWYTTLIDGVNHASAMAIVTVGGTVAPPSLLTAGDDLQLSVEPYFVAVGVPPDSPPPQAQRERAATGGTPPYTYESSNRYVAAVDASGRVTATGNGLTSIKVTDAKGETASFNLTVTGATVFMCVRNEPFVGSDFRQNLQPALENLRKAEYSGSMAGIAPSIGELRSLWRQYRDLLPGLAGKLNWEEASESEALYWVRDSRRNEAGTGDAYVVNLNARDEKSLVRVVPNADLAKTRAFVAMVEGNHWLGFETYGGRYSWYQDGTYARAAVPVQPWRSRDGKAHEIESGGKA